MKKAINLALSLVILFAANSLVAQNFAYVNTQEILQGLPEIKEANANIETFRNQLINLGQKMESLNKNKRKEISLQNNWRSKHKN